MSPALSKTFWIFIEIEFYKHIDLQKNRNDIKFLSDKLYGKERYRSGLKQTAFCSLSDIYPLFYIGFVCISKKDIYFSCSRLHAVRQINFEQKLGLHGDDEFIKLS